MPAATHRRAVTCHLAVVASRDAVRVQHRHHFEDEVLPERYGSQVGGVREQGEASGQAVRRRGLARVHARRQKDHLRSGASCRREIERGGLGRRVRGMALDGEARKREPAKREKAEREGEV